MSPSERARSLLQSRWRELVSYLRVLSGRRLPPRRYLVVCGYRTGSHLLQSLAGCHPQLRAGGEVFLPFLYTRFSRVLWPRAYLYGQARAFYTPVYGCLVRLSQLQRVGACPEPFLRQCHEEGWKLVHLQRQNPVRQAISHLLAERDQRWHATDQRSELRTSLPVDQVETRARRFLAESRREVSLLADLAHLRISYELDLLPPEHHQATLNRLFAWVGLPPHPVHTRLVRTSGPSPGERVLNYGEICRHLETTDLAVHLD